MGHKKSLIWLSVIFVLKTQAKNIEIIENVTSGLIVHTYEGTVTDPSKVIITAANPTLTPEVEVSTREQAQIAHLKVKVSNGLIEGHELQTKDLNKTFYAFQGIPYAKPPINDLRFREPVAAEDWNETFKATAESLGCTRSLSVVGSEDCLYLNVFSPKLNENSSLPVMVWLHGEEFNGKPLEQIHTLGPDYFINEDVLIVTVNYRVGVFGFLSTEDYSATGNWGLKDQVLALRWVKKNIANFGGNPENVLLFGSGPGSACASILIQSPLAKGLFHKAILQSGTSLNQWAHAKHPKKSAFAVGKLLDIHTNSSEELVGLLRKVDYRTLQVVSVSTDLRESIFHNPLDGLVFAPSTEVNHPGAVLTNSSHSILKNGDFSRIPVIVGFNSQEALGSIDVLNYLRPYVTSFDLFSTRLVPESLRIDRYLRKIVVAQLIRLKYFGWKPLVFSSDKLVQFVTDDLFARPIYEYVKQSSKFAPTYFYIFSYEGALGANGKPRETSGVSHGEELNYLWNKTSNIENAPLEDILVRQRLIRLWTNFAKTGNPTPAQENLLQNVTWPPTNLKTLIYLNISHNLQLDNDSERYSVQFWEEIFSRHGNPSYDSY